jgi:membrane protease YdiL (CAAX protease family)
MATASASSFRRITLAWILIAICLSVVVLRNVLSDRARDLEQLGAPPGTATSAMPTGVEMQMRYLVGLHELSPQVPLDKPLEQLEQELAKNGTPRNRLSMVPVLDQLRGEAAARERLARLDREVASLPAVARPALAALHQLYPAPAGAVSATGAAAVTVADPGRQIVRSLGWAGQLAAGHGHLDGAMHDRAMATALRMTVTMLALLALAAAALATAVAFCVLIAQRKLTPAYVPDASGDPVWAEVFALYLAAFLGCGEALRRIWGHGELPMWGIWLFVLVAPLFYGVVRNAGPTWPGMRAALGWQAGTGPEWLLKEIGAGMVGWLAGTPVVILLAIIAGRLAPDLHPEHPLVGEALEGHGWSHWLLLASVASGFAPLVEETMFRGALFHHLRGHLGWWWAALAGGMVFAALHPQGLAAIPPLTAMAVVFTAIRTWRGSAVANMAAHACNNGAVLALLWCVQS